MIWKLVGITAAAIIGIGFIPQIVKGAKTRHLEDVSIYMMFLIFTGMFLWLLYGLHISDKIVWGANVFGCCMVSIIILMKIRFEGKRAFLRL